MKSPFPPLAAVFTLTSALLLNLPNLAHGQAAAPAVTPTPGTSPVAGANTGSGAPKPEDIGISKDFSPCMDRAQSQPKEQQPTAFYACLESERKKQDTRINTAYQQSLAKLPAEGKKRLTASQGHWVRYRDSHCNFYADERGAPPLNLNNSDCRLGMNVQRANEMENINRLVQEEEKAARAQGALPGPAGTAAAASPATPATPAAKPNPNMGAGSGMSLPKK